VDPATIADDIHRQLSSTLSDLVLVQRTELQRFVTED
jgi:hypothetical protein